MSSRARLPMNPPKLMHLNLITDRKASAGRSVLVTFLLLEIIPNIHRGRLNVTHGLGDSVHGVGWLQGGRAYWTKAAYFMASGKQKEDRSQSGSLLQSHTTSDTPLPTRPHFPTGH